MQHSKKSAAEFICTDCGRRMRGKFAAKRHADFCRPVKEKKALEARND